MLDIAKDLPCNARTMQALVGGQRGFHLAELHGTFYCWKLQISGKQIWEALNHLSKAYKRNCLHRVVDIAKSYITLGKELSSSVPVAMN